jgi:hypothetical protein
VPGSFGPGSRQGEEDRSGPHAPRVELDGGDLRPQQALIASDSGRLGQEFAKDHRCHLEIDAAGRTMLFVSS